MKKLSTLILVLCMLLSAVAFTACGEKTVTPSDSPVVTDGGATATEDAATPAATEEVAAPVEKTESVYEIVSGAIANTVNAKSYEAEITALLKRNLMGMLSEDEALVNIKGKSLDTAKPEIYANSKITMEGYSFEQAFYYDGEWQYVSNEYDGYKIRATVGDFAKETRAPQSIIMPLPEEIFDNVEGVKNDDGSLTVTLSVDEVTFETLYRDAVVGVVSDVCGEDLNQTVTMGATITITVADGYVRSYSVVYTTEITAGNDKVTYDSKQTVEFISCDKDVTITPPANYKDFYEMDWG